MRRKKLIAFSAVTTVVVSVACAVMIKSTKQQTLTVTDKDGVTYVAIIDQNQKIYAGVTDASGSMYAAKIENGVVMKDSPLYVVGDYTGTYPDNNTTRSDNISINQNNNEDFDFNGEAETKETTETTKTSEGEENSGENETKKPSQKKEPQKKEPEEYQAYKYTKLFNSGVFAMTFTTDDPELTEEITIAMRNGSLYMDTSMEGIACKVLYDANKKAGYMIIPQMRVYCAMPEDLVKDISTTEFEMPDISEAKKAEIYEVTIDGKDCVCEEFEYKNGEKRDYYFYNDSLVRMTAISGGETTLYNIKTLTSDVDSSYFELPKGYLKVDLSWLETQAE